MFKATQKGKQITSKDDEKCRCPKATIKPQENNSKDCNYQNCKSEPNKKSNQGSQALINYKTSQLEQEKSTRPNLRMEKEQTNTQSIKKIIQEFVRRYI